MGTACPKRVILTRSREDIERDKPLFEKFGFEVVPLPLIKTEPIDFEPPKEKPHFVVFQSAKAVRYFLNKHSIENTRIVAVGEKTKKALEEMGYKVWKVPQENTARGILELFPQGKGETILIPRSEQGRLEAIEGLREKGYRVLPINVYRTVAEIHTPKRVEDLLSGGGFIVFASPSAVRGLFANLQKDKAIRLLGRLVVVSIGKTTKKELEKFGLEPNLIPTKPLMEEVAVKIHEYWQRNCLS